MITSKIHNTIPAGQTKPFANFKAEEYAGLGKSLGIFIDEGSSVKMRDYAAKLTPVMDALQPTVTTGTVTTPVQFLQQWLPGFVRVVTAARNIDLLVGMSVVGQWEDEQVVQGVMELTGKAVPYGDSTNVPFANWNNNFEYRTVVRFEQGMKVGRLEEARSGRIRVNSSAEKRESCALMLEIERNRVGFFGYNNGANQTYGFLNDPSLPAYVPVPPGASTFTTWQTKTYLEIVQDLQTAFADLRNQSQDNINPAQLDVTLGVATNAVTFLSTVSQYGNSVNQWLQENYPKTRVVSAPQLNGANGGQSVFYLYADSFNDSSTDDGRTFIQPVPAKFMVLGVDQTTKGFEEDYANATAGIMCKRPWAVVRFSGI